MGNKKSFEDRITESEVFIADGNLKSAISTLVKAKGMNQIKAKELGLKSQIEELQDKLLVNENQEENIDELNDKLGEEKIEKVEEELKKEKSVDPPKEKETKKDEDDLDPDEIIEFRVTAPFCHNSVPYEHKTIHKLQRVNDFVHVIALEDE